jgi:hypothetical protein
MYWDAEGSQCNSSTCYRQSDQIGRNFAIGLLNQFSPTQAVSTHGLLWVFQHVQKLFDVDILDFQIQL